ncbi:MAG: aldehyde dehydrogenase family protein, partial [Clostridiales bacterium]
MHMIIDGKKTNAADGKVIKIINPATGEVIDTVPAATEADIILAVQKAKAGQKIWAQVPVHQKGTIL